MFLETHFALEICSR